MEFQGEPGRVQVTQATKEALDSDYTRSPRGNIDAKGIGPMPTWWLS